MSTAYVRLDYICCTGSTIMLGWLKKQIALGHGKNAVFLGSIVVDLERSTKLDTFVPVISFL